MAKKSGLWDDSALVNAFEEAMSNYKKKHIEGYMENSTADEEVKSNSRDASSMIDQGQEVKSHVETGDESSLGSHMAEEMRPAKDSATDEGNENVASQDPGEQGSNLNPMPDMFQSYPSSQDIENYNELYRHYYELEEQRKKILQKLQQFGTWNHSYHGESSGSCMQWGTAPLQEHQSYTSQASQQNFPFSCCPYVCQCSIAPCTSLAPCSFSGACAGTLCNDTPLAIGVGKKSVLEDAGVVATAMGAAEKAISMLKEKTSDNVGKMKIKLPALKQILQLS
ncbi:hypothetical protein Nepgr_011022 [Nepenthes gracilis]|uniref:Survival Motor Neuron Gemin2-binding domain-containing protein n=1 Tax=Nepenthes gracilis TaxID=150966 RepID=A0AAD3SEJ4_NEPGR|nr:hypothetical protein Nepgr_011022 [Nepenthes gracilis]